MAIWQRGEYPNVLNIKNRILDLQNIPIIGMFVYSIELLWQKIHLYY